MLLALENCGYLLGNREKWAWVWMPFTCIVRTFGMEWSGMETKGGFIRIKEDSRFFVGYMNVDLGGIGGICEDVWMDSA